ncbi:MAG: glucose-6-phosphate isomerase [Pseudomonadota bacterium]|nr:glucose-6-phosphate isomerase [Pseudomonadota bacterium]
MLYDQDVSNCYTFKGLKNPLTEKYNMLLEESIARICGDGGLEIPSALRIVECKDDLPKLREIAHLFQNEFADVVILGTGGSSLGGKCICALAKSNKPKLHFVDNIDPATFAELFAVINPASTGVLVISKSGDTSETLAQFNVFVQWFETRLTPSEVSGRVKIITQQRSSALREIGNKKNFDILNHDPNIGGRFSAFSLVGILPALIAGVDISSFRKGAATTLIHARKKRHKSAPAQGAALKLAASRHATLGTDILMLYSDKLFWFGQWYRQLWAESIGKDGYGATPVPFLGTVDQHSQLQLYLDGPSDKLFTAIMHGYEDIGIFVNPSATGNVSLGALEQRTLGDLINASQHGTIDALVAAHRPVRTIATGELNAAALGALMMHFMLETIITADLLGIDPFNQPAVEEGKTRTKQYLKNFTDKC